MNIKSVEVCIVITILAIIGFFIHSINGVAALLGYSISAISALSLFFMTFNIFVLSSFRGIANICGVYSGPNRYLKARRFTTYSFAAASVVGLILYRMYVVETFVAVEILNLTGSFAIINCFGFGKTRGKFLWSQYI